MAQDTNLSSNGPPESERELIVMAKPQAGLRATTAGVTSATGVDVTSLESLLASEEVALEPLFGTSEEQLISEAAALAPATDVEVPDLSVYYRVQAPDDQLDALAEQLAQQETIEAAYVKPASELAIAPDQVEEETAAALAADDALPATPDFTARQIYLNAAPAGIDARYAWTIAGGRGTGIGIIDIEGAWNFSHEDLLKNQGGVIGGTPTTDLGWRNHGTNVAGVFGGDRNNFGVTGICPDANTRAISIFPTRTMGSARAIRQAADASKVGDIILIEIHRAGPRFSYQRRNDQRGYIAVEWWPDDYAAIRYAVSKGVIVVEAAGNGAENLDDALYNTPGPGFPSSWKNPFNSANPTSNAVVVGAGAPPPGTHGRNNGPDRSRLGFSNYGSRVDCQGWGREVTTTGGRRYQPGDLQNGSNENVWYSDTFSGTSSASPMIVGTLGCVQGILRAQGSPLLSASRARSLLRATGSPQQNAPGRPATQRIGTRPNLRQLIPLATETWHNNVVVRYCYATNASQAAWAYINGLGWRRLKSHAADGVTNMFDALCEALANGRRVNVYADQSFIYRVVLR